MELARAVENGDEWGCELAGLLLDGGYDHKEGAEHYAADVNKALKPYLDAADKMAEALTRLRDCDWAISLPDRMDAVRDIARGGLEPWQALDIKGREGDRG